MQQSSRVPPYAYMSINPNLNPTQIDQRLYEEVLLRHQKQMAEMTRSMFDHREPPHGHWVKEPTTAESFQFQQYNEYICFMA